MTEPPDRPSFPEEKQRYTRTSTLFPGELIAAAGAVPCQVLNISAGGAKVRLSEPWMHELAVTLRIDRFTFVGEIVWQYDDCVGLSFVGDPAEIEQIIDEELVKLRDPADRRRFARVSVLMSGKLFSGGEMVDCVVLNISAGGAKVRVLQPLEFDSAVRLRVERFGDFPGVVAWQDGAYIGLQFLIEPSEVIRRVAETLPRSRIDPDGTIEE